jgi:hypothetical protein
MLPTSYGIGPEVPILLDAERLKPGPRFDIMEMVLK